MLTRRHARAAVPDPNKSGKARFRFSAEHWSGSGDGRQERVRIEAIRLPSGSVLVLALATASRTAFGSVGNYLLWSSRQTIYTQGLPFETQTQPVGQTPPEQTTELHTVAACAAVGAITAVINGNDIAPPTPILLISSLLVNTGFCPAVGPANRWLFLS